jgi:hypothetical protein
MYPLPTPENHGLPTADGVIAALVGRTPQGPGWGPAVAAKEASHD